jgi:hypothetical protein
VKRTLIAVGALTSLLIAVDQLYRLLHPRVELARAVLVGLTAYASLALGAAAGVRVAGPGVGGLAIFTSAFVSVLLIEAGWLASRSPASAAFHFLVLALAFLLLDGAARALRMPPPGGRAAPRHR